MLNTRKIKARMVELGITQKDAAKFLCIAQPTINQKINNIRPMDLEEAEKLADLLQLNAEEFQPYFFCSQVAQRNSGLKGEEA